MKERCTAPTKSGRRCKLSAGEGGVCHLHDPKNKCSTAGCNRVKGKGCCYCAMCQTGKEQYICPCCSDKCTEVRANRMKKFPPEAVKIVIPYEVLIRLFTWLYIEDVRALACVSKFFRVHAGYMTTKVETHTLAMKHEKYPLMFPCIVSDPHWWKEDIIELAGDKYDERTFQRFAREILEPWEFFQELCRELDISYPGVLFKVEYYHYEHGISLPSEYRDIDDYGWFGAILDHYAEFSVWFIKIYDKKEFGDLCITECSKWIYIIRYFIIMGDYDDSSMQCTYDCIKFAAIKVDNGRRDSKYKVYEAICSDTIQYLNDYDVDIVDNSL